MDTTTARSRYAALLDNGWTPEQMVALARWKTAYWLMSCYPRTFTLPEARRICFCRWLRERTGGPA